jgi:uncharacterized protein (DUF1015 family)
MRALRPVRDAVQEVACVPYDVVDLAEARAFAEGKPNSLMRVERAEIDLPDGTDPHGAPVYERAAENFARLRRTGVLVAEPAPLFYVYRQRARTHTQRGIVACCHVQDYRSDLIRRHESTREDKVSDRACLIRALRAHTGPVFLAYRDRPEIDERVRRAESGAPLMSVTAADGVEHAVWPLPDGDAVTDALARVPRAYICDGHHRAAAAERVARECAATGGEDAEHNWFLCVLLPASQLRVLPYHRCVTELNGLSSDAFLAAVRERFAVRTSPAREDWAAGHIGMYLASRWHELSWNVNEPVVRPVEAIASAVLQRRLLAPVLGVSDPRTDPRMIFVGGARGCADLARRVDAGQAAVAFGMPAVTLDEIMAVSDDGGTMPPKSTWFEPKLWSGFLVHTF